MLLCFFLVIFIGRVIRGKEKGVDYDKNIRTIAKNRVKSLGGFNPVFVFAFVLCVSSKDNHRTGKRQKTPTN